MPVPAEGNIVVTPRLSIVNHLGDSELLSAVKTAVVGLAIGGDSCDPPDVSGVG